VIGDLARVSLLMPGHAEGASWTGCSEVASPALFGIKVASTIGATNGLGAYLYWRGTRQSNSLAVRPMDASR